MSVITGQQEHQHLLQDAAVATGNGTAMDVRKYNSITTQNIGAWTSATVTFEGTIDETTWVAIQGTLVNDGTFATTSSTTDEIRVFDVAGLVSFRARISTYASGTLTVSARATPVGGGGAGSPTSVDLNEPVDVQGPVADGSTSTGNPVIMGSVDAAGNVQFVKINASGEVPVASRGTTADGATNTGALLTSSDSGNFDALRVYPLNFNGTTWDRMRNNEEITLLAAAARTVETDSADFVNYNGKGILITVDWTSEAGTSTLTPNIFAVDPVSAEEFVLWIAAAGITAVGNTSYLLYPGALAADFDGTESAQVVLPRTFFFRMGVGTADSNTYSVGAAIIS